MAFGIVCGPGRESLLPRLTSLGQSARLELVFVAYPRVNAPIWRRGGFTRALVRTVQAAGGRAELA